MSKIREFLARIGLIEEAYPEMWEMVNLRPIETGVPKVIYVSPKQGSHGARIKLGVSSSKAIPGKWISITIADSPVVIGRVPSDITQNDIELAKQWICLNKEVLLKFSVNQNLDELYRGLRCL